MLHTPGDLVRRQAVRLAAASYQEPEWSEVEKEIQDFNKVYEKVKSWARIQGPRVVDELSKKPNMEIIKDFAYGGDSARAGSMVTHSGQWIKRNFGDDAYKGLSLSLHYVRDGFDTLRIFLTKPDEYRDLLENGRALKNALDPLDDYVSNMNSMLKQVGPVKLGYLGFKVLNPDRIPEKRLLQILRGIEYLVQLFRKRGMEKALTKGVKDVLVRYYRSSETGVAYYDEHVRRIILTDEILRTTSGRTMKKWVHEVFVHEFGHHIHMGYLHPDARKEWDSGWNPVESAKEKLDSNLRITGADRKRFFELIKRNGMSPKKAGGKLKGIDRLKFMAWLRQPGLGEPLITPKQVRLTNHGEAVFGFLADPDRYVAERSGVSSEEQKERWKEIRMKRIKEDVLQLDWDGSEMVPIDMQERIRKEDKTIDTELAKLEIPTEYGRMNKVEDFAETFVVFMDDPSKLSDKARFRMQRALSLSGLYGKPVMRLSRDELAHLATLRRTCFRRYPIRTTLVERDHEVMFPSLQPERIAARYKDKTEDKDGNVQYEYSKRQVQHRNREKANRLDGLRSSMPKLKKKLKVDLRSSDPKTRMTSLAIGLMDETFERPGNDESADGGHVGVTGWQRKHVNFNGGKATIDYTGKSGVKQRKVVSDPGLVTALRDSLEGKDPEGRVFSFDHEGVEGCVRAEDVNSYLEEFGITGKDLRGYHANDEMIQRLKGIRDKGPELPRGRKERDGILRSEFERALNETAKMVGHEPSTLRSDYLVPNLSESYLHDGTVLSTFKAGCELDPDHLVMLATKDTTEREDASAKKLMKKEPKKNPPRHDLRKERVDAKDDPDLKKPNATNDRDLSHNYKGRNAKSGRSLRPIGKGFMGGMYFRMDVRDDLFVHFTPSSHALGIIKDGRLKMNPPYQKFGGGGVYGVSLIYGSSVPSVQTTHIKTDGELVAIVFRTSAVPDFGAVEEVVWARDVPLRGAKLIPARQAFAMLSRSPEKIGGQDLVYYEGSPNLDKILEEVKIKVASMADRYVLAFEEPDWARGKKFKHRTESGETTQVGWSSLTPEEQKAERTRHESPGDKEPDDGIDLPKAEKDFEVERHETIEEQKDKEKKQTEEEEKAEREKAEAEEKARAEALEARVKEVKGNLKSLASSAGLPDDEEEELRRHLDGMDDESRDTVVESINTKLKSLMEDERIDPGEAEDLVDSLKEKVPKDPQDLGEILAQRVYARAVVLNPLMTGGRAVSGKPKTPDELRGRSSSARTQFMGLKKEHRESAAKTINDRLGQVDPDGHEAKELNAIMDGLAVASMLHGESVEGRPPPSTMLIAVAHGLERRGEVDKMFDAVDTGSVTGRSAIKDGLRMLSDPELAAAVSDNPVTGALGEWLVGEGVSEKHKQELRQMIVDLAHDDMVFIDPMIRDGLEATGEKDSLDHKRRSRIKKSILEASKKDLGDQPPEDEDWSEYSEKIRMGVIGRALDWWSSLQTKATSMAAAMLGSARSEKNLDVLNQDTSEPVSRPVPIKSSVKPTPKHRKKSSQSASYTALQLSEGPGLFSGQMLSGTNPTRGIRRKSMPVLLTQKGAEQIQDHLNRIAQVVQDRWHTLGIPDREKALDFAFRCDLVADTISRKAAENSRYVQEKLAQATGPTVAPGTIKDEEGDQLAGGSPEQDNMTKEKQGPNDWDESQIGEMKAPIRQDADEPYMGAFVQDELHQLADVQQKGMFSNAPVSALPKAASAKEQLASIGRQLVSLAQGM